MTKPDRLACVAIIDKGACFNWHVVDWLSWRLRVGLVVRIPELWIRMDVV